MALERLTEICRRWGWGKRFLALGLAFFALSLPPALWWGPSALLRYGLTRGLETQGLRVAALDRAVFSLTQGRIDLRKLDVRPPLGAPLTVARIDLAFSWRAMLAGRIEIAELSISGLDLRIERGTDGAWRLPIPAGPTGVPTDAGTPPLALGIARLVATESRIVLIDGTASMTFDVDRFAAAGFDLRRPDGAMDVELSARVAGGRVRADGTGTPLAPAPEIAGTLRADGVELGAIAAFLGQAFSGTLDADLSLRARGTRGEAQGRLAVDRPRVAGAAAAALEWRGRATFGPRDPVEIDGAGAARDPVYETEGTRISAERLETEGLRVRIADGTLRIETRAEVLGAKFMAADLAASAARVTSPVLNVDIHGGTLTADVRMAVEAGAVATPDIGAQARGVELEGRFADGRFAGRGAFDGVDIDAKAADVAASAARISVEGALDVARTAFDGRLRAAELNIGRNDGLDLVAIGALALDGAKFDATTRRAGPIVAERVRALRRETARADVAAFPWRLEAPRLDADSIVSASDGKVRVGSVRARGPVLRVTRTPTGFVSFDALAKGREPSAGQGPGFRIEGLAIDDARLEFVDRAVATPVRLGADRVLLRLGALDTASPEASARARLRAQVGASGTLELDGDIAPLAAKIGFALSGGARGIDLPPFSPYVADALGVDLRTGRFDVDLDLAARAEALAGTSHWRIRNLEIDDRGVGALAREAGAPLQMALGLLRDSAGDIALDIPIAGRLDDPSFDTSDAVRQAVGGAMRGALSATFNALFPFGFILGALVDGEARAAVPPVTFAPGLSALDAQDVAALDALAGVLAARPSARLELCGFAGPSDLRALNAARGTEARGQELVETLRRLFARATGIQTETAGADELRALAEERARAVAERLTADGRVEAGRLYQCRPVVETAADAHPRVELKF